jgi:YkoY family integral membrane protein
MLRNNVAHFPSLSPFPQKEYAVLAYIASVFSSVFAHVPSFPEIVSATPTILSLIMIEGLLSVDNAMAIAALASDLPAHQQKKALRYGIIGAYGFRGICLAFAAWIAANMWVKVIGSLYLIHVMTANLIEEEVDESKGLGDHVQHKSFWGTIVAIELMDLMFSIDNVVAAVALDKRLWVVVTGVFIGILALRFVAGYCIALINKYPILNKTAFLLVGFVGVLLGVEIALEYSGIHFHLSSVLKFACIAFITGSTLVYAHTPWGKALFTPVVKVGMPAMHAADAVINVLFLPVTYPVGLIKRAFAKKDPTIKT